MGGNSYGDVGPMGGTWVIRSPERPSEVTGALHSELREDRGQQRTVVCVSSCPGSCPASSLEQGLNQDSLDEGRNEPEPRLD